MLSTRVLYSYISNFSSCYRVNNETSAIQTFLAQFYFKVYFNFVMFHQSFLASFSLLPLPRSTRIYNLCA